MNLLPEFGKILIGLGILFIIIGLALMLATKIPFLGRLPGDLVIHRGNFTFYFPLATSIILSIILTLLFYIFRK